MSDLEVMQKMIDRDSRGINMSPFFVEARKAAGGGHLTMGIAEELLHRIVMEPDKWLFGLYVVDKNEFNAIRDSGEKSGIELISEERKRQIESEGWTPEHDDQHTDGELAEAASCYAAYATSIKIDTTNEWDFHPPMDTDMGYSILRTHRWPFSMDWWKPSPENRIRELQKAGALIAAEIDRLNRIQES